VLKPGSRIGPYELLDVLGSGTAATTYSAYREGDRRLVALKVPHPLSRRDTTFVVRFLQEGALGARLRHASIVRVYDAGEDGEDLYLAMEFVNGITLRDHLKAGRVFAVDDALGIIREVAGALAYAHSNGVIHRDLKPGHVMLVPGGGLKVMDLGVARAVGDVALTAANVFLGTPQYAAPEAVDARTADERSDLYSLGMILFEMLEGKPPFHASTPAEMILALHEHRFPAREDLSNPPPQPVWDLIVSLCAQDPNDRPASAQEVVERINGILEGGGLHG